MIGPTLLLLLRARDDRARAHVLETLRANAGDVTRTAAALEVSSDSLYRAAARDGALGVAFRALAQGRSQVGQRRRRMLQTSGNVTEKK